MSSADLCIWWINETDARAIGDVVPKWPAYLRRQFESRYGRAGRGRLWVDKQFPIVEIPWPDTPLTRGLSEDYGGIVMRRSDVHHLAAMPGVITDLAVRRLDIGGCR